MGNYNTHQPIILGNEWAPIRQASFKPDNTTEIGYTFVLQHGAIVVSGYYYDQENPPNQTGQVAELISVYAAGTESDTGPIQQVIIPVSAITTTGTGISGAASDLQVTTDNGAISFAQDPNTQSVGINFDVASYQGQLQGRRILNVELLYQAGGTTEDLADWGIVLSRISLGVGANIALQTDLVGASSLSFVSALEAVQIGDVGPFWNLSVNPALETRAYPWRWEELNNLSATATFGAKVQVVFTGSSATTPGVFSTFRLGYAALRVTYCTERRVLYGAHFLGTTNSTGNTFRSGTAAPVNLLTTALTTPTALAPGAYTVTQSHRLIGDNSGIFAIRVAPTMYGLRELYNLFAQVGLEVDQSLIIGATFAQEPSNVLPQVTLHTGAGVVTGCHVYGAQVAAPIYGSVTAAQVISNAGNTTPSYPQVRFYARRFGDTTVPLVLTSGAFSVSITPATFDALPEIVDGWREVTLRFASAPTGTNVGATWTFSATGENAGNRWEILGADALVQPSAPQGLDVATYLAPTGGTQTLTWQAPVVTGATLDTSADVTLLFSQDPPTVTGFAISAGSQAITGVAAGCVPARCIPTAITCNQVSWTSLAVYDLFERVVAPGGLGNLPSGQTWTIIAGTASEFQVDGAQAIVTATSTAAHRALVSTFTAADVVVRGIFGSTSAPTGSADEEQIIARYVDGNNFVDARIFINPGSVTCAVRQLVAGVETVSAFVTVPGAVNTVPIAWEFTAQGGTLSLKAWAANTPKPTAPTVTMTTTMVSSGQVGWSLASGSAPFPDTLSILEFSATPTSIDGGTLEVQRMDTVDTTWHDVVNTTTLGLSGFCDYEARVGVVSSYRARLVNVLGFAGSWSVTGTGTVAAPGVTTGGDGNSVLIFTSNLQPASNLAYPMTWDNTPVEMFAFPEADTQTFMRMYGRDFQVAFRPLERGGEEFERVILVQAAAIPLESLADFKGLRDLAWADLPYVCVRDELGNRWYANVLVPAGQAVRNRTLYMAQIRVTEVTDTPAPIS